MEEKKNTMENQVGGVNDLSIISKLTTSDTETMKDITASGSVAAPKEEDQKIFDDLVAKGAQSLFSELASLRDQLRQRDELIANLKQDIVRLVEDVNKAYDH